MLARRAGRALTALCATAISVAALHAQSEVMELNAAGWKALNSGYSDRAAALFAEALTLRPNDPVLLLGSGASAHAQGKQQDAMARLKRALQLNPRLIVASRLLGEIAYTEGEVELAIRTYEQALKYAPDDPELASELEAWREDSEIHHGFEERRYDQFRVMFEGPEEKAVAVQATRVLNEAFRRIAQKLGEYPTNTIVAILYSQKQFRDITRAPEWSGGQYDGRIRIPVAGASEKPELFERVLTHELTHAMLAAIAPRGIPTWLNEGIAQHFDGADLQAAQQRMKALGRSFPLKKLEPSFAPLSAADAQVAYDESLLAAGVLFDRPAFGWTRLLHRLADGQAFEDAIKNFGLSYADLEAPFAHPSQTANEGPVRK
jgi:tetratricopeptide (TPR) repeat protein